MWQLQKKESGTYGVTIGDKEYEIKDGQIEEVEPVVNPYAENGWIKAWGYKEAGEAWSDEINDPNELKNGNYDITAKVYELNETNETNADYGLVIEGKGTIKNVLNIKDDQETGEQEYTGSAWMSGIVVNNNDVTISGTIFSSNTVKVTICDGIEGIGTYMTMQEYLSAMQSSDEVSYGEFLGNKITEIVFPRSLKSIGYGSFSYCQSLTELNIPKGITEIGYMAFYQCTSLQQVTIGDVESIGGYAFTMCTSLQQVTIGDVESIGVCAFTMCTSLQQVTIGDVESIDSYAFSYCSNLETITIHKPEGSVTGAKWGAPDTTQIIWDE